MKKSMFLLSVFMGALLLGWGWDRASGAQFAQDTDPVIQQKLAFWDTGRPWWEIPHVLPVNREPPLQTLASPLDMAQSASLWNQIVFQSYRDGNWEIYMMNADGSQQRRLTHDDAAQVRPKLRFDLSQILYLSPVQDQFRLFVMQADGSDPRPLHPSTYWPEGYPAWSPDGRYIAYSVLKDDHWGLFMANADGTGERRLTRPTEGHDIHPTWSPDGRYLAWVHRRSGGYGDVMVMDLATGESEMWYSGLRYLQHVLWSPDGQYLAMDADYNGDEWNDLLLGERSRILNPIILSPGNMVDLWAGSWSPDSQKLVYTQVTYAVVDNQLVITQANLGYTYAYPYSDVRYALPGSGADMFPDWQLGVDHQPPLASITPLPQISPSPIHVIWSGWDEGPSGIHAFDVQVRIDDSEWGDWRSESMERDAWFDGEAGRRYAFRVRARDNAGNVSPWAVSNTTTVETLPPHTEFVGLSSYLNGPTGTVHWQGEDPGGSGIQAYQLQYREAGSQQWQYLTYSTTSTSYPASNLMPSHRYFLRIRAIDRAGNEEPWDEHGQGPITIYSWGASGRVLSNRGSPVPDAWVSSQPPAWSDVRTDASGHYQLYVGDYESQYTLSWGHPSMGSLPPTSFLLRDGDVQLDVTLPPSDNVIQNGHFEDGYTAWTRAGATPPRLASRHVTGAKSMQLGQTPQPHLRITTPHDAIHLVLRKDARDNLYILWEDNSGSSELMFAQLDAYGNLVEQRTLASFSSSPRRSMTVSPEGHVYILWTSPAHDWHYLIAHRSPDGQWSDPQPMDRGGNVIAAADASNRLHLYFRSGYYIQCEPSGACSEPEEVGHYDTYMNQNFTVTPQGDVYFTWYTSGSSYKPAYIYFRLRYADGRWTPVYRFIVSRSMLWSNKPLHIRVDRRQTLHFLLDTVSSALYARVSRDGHVLVQPLSDISYPGTMALLPGASDTMNILAVAGQYGRLTLHHLQVNAEGQFTLNDQQLIPSPIAQDVWDAVNYRFAQDGQGRIYAVANGKQHLHNGDIHVAVRDVDGQWNFWEPFGASCDAYTMSAGEKSPQIVIDSQDTMQLIWSGDSPHCDIFHTTGRSRSTDTSQLSQQVTLPAQMPEATLSFYARLNGAPHANAPLQVQVQTADGASTPLLTIEDADTWQHHWVDMTPWLGQTITLTFTISHTAGDPLRWGYVEDVSLGTGAYVDAWVSAPAQVVPASAHTVPLTILFGNQGWDAFPSARLTYQMPPGTSLATAEPPPSGQQDDRVWWDVNDVPASHRDVIHLTLNAPALQSGQTLTGTLGIQTSWPDMQPGNNTWTTYVFVDGTRLRLPLVLK